MTTLDEGVAGLYEALEHVPDGALMLGDPRVAVELRAILLDWLQAVRDRARTHRLIDKRSPLTSWVVKHLLSDCMHVARAECGLGLDAELVSLIERRELDICDAMATKALGDRMDGMQQLTAGFAHELRNPVNAARLQLEVLGRRTGRNPPDGPAALALFELQAIADLLDDFLLFARPSPLELEAHDAVSLVERAVDSERPFATHREIELQLVTGVTTAAVEVDGTKLMFLVEELVHNAIEAAPPGGHVDVELDLDREAIRLAVRDDGAGIEPGLRNRIYEPFFSTRDSGRGLGLAIVHAFVMLHRGVIELASTTHGTRFDVTIPVRRLA